MCKNCGCSNKVEEKKEVVVEKQILYKNMEEAMHNKKHFDENKVLCINLMSSAGSGKTTLLESTIKALKDEFFISVIEGDLETNNDANRVIKAGAKAYQITTGQTCHLDALMIHKALNHIDLKETQLLFIENVGNLVCPASYALGEHINVVLLSVTEGSDKPQKYPVMFRKADLVVISKSDLAPHFDFNFDEAIKACKELNPNVRVIKLDAKNGTNLNEWLEFLRKEVKDVSVHTV
ncbi:hydrogenase nickel incorporation protein HypB [uncultured Campylobacter sp.]|uniref:hydrogenase nickel incorporation protein HypB n=1 Tax=uncultured Campylobacter sp. TaxID=218934 RepID=UPI0034550D52